MAGDRCELIDVDVDRRRLLRARHWTGHGRPLVLLHGFLDSSQGWTTLASDVHRPCIACDLPGFGGSSLPAAPRISAYADDILVGLSALGIEDYDLIGHSLGGAVAAAVAERSGSVRSLLLLAPAGFGPLRLADLCALPGVSALTTHALPLALAATPLIEAAYMTLVTHGQRPSRELLAQVHQSARWVGAGARFAVEALARCGHGPTAFVHRGVSFDGPVAALWGSRDVLVPVSHAKGLGRALPQARIEIWRGMGHHPQRERPVELVRFIKRSARRACSPPRRRNTSRARGPARAVGHARRRSKARSVEERRVR